MFFAQNDFSISRQKHLSRSAMHVCVPGAQYSFRRSNKVFLRSFAQGVYIFEGSPKSIQVVFGDVYCPGKYYSNREKCEPSLDGYVTTPRSIFGCGKCGAWLFVHKVPFKLQEHVKTTQTDRTRFFFAKNG